MSEQKDKTKVERNSLNRKTHRMQSNCKHVKENISMFSILLNLALNSAINN